MKITRFEGTVDEYLQVFEIDDEMGLPEHELPEGPSHDNFDDGGPYNEAPSPHITVHMTKEQATAIQHGLDNTPTHNTYLHAFWRNGPFLAGINGRGFEFDITGEPV